jgi:predicted anti-sigma-YlaC factor YlaD
MTKHYTEADLLETYYMQPEEASAIIAHVDDCKECQERYRRLAEKLRESATCATDKPATFWTRQRMIIMRGVEKARSQSDASPRAGRIAAAAMLAFLLGGALVYKTVPRQKPPVVVVTASNAATSDDDLQVPRDPWQSDDLKDFGSVVAWESWNQ